MRSGLLRQRFNIQDPLHILNRAYPSPFHGRILIHDYPLVHDPGTRFDYSNANAELVALIIERATGMRYSEFLSEALLKPLGARGGALWLNRPGGLAHSGTGVQLPAETWLRLALLVLQNGVWEGKSLLPENYVTITKEASLHPPVGRGLYLSGDYVERLSVTNPDVTPAATIYHSQPHLAHDLVLFDGNANNLAYIAPLADLVVVRLGPPGLSEPEWDNTAIANILLADILD